MNTSTTSKKFRKTFAIKRLSTFLRTVYSYLRTLPAFTFFSKSGFDYSIEHKIYYEENENSYDYVENFNKMKKSVKSCCDVGISNVKLQVEYLNKCDIFLFEQEIVKNYLLKLIFFKF